MDSRKKMTLEELILNIINTQIISDQKTLLNKISKHGHSIDQSTLSRILKKLKITKYLGKYTIEKTNKTNINIKNNIVIVPPNLIIINTKPGFANAISALLDQNPTQGVAGTVAGDDTIFVAVLPNFEINQVKNEIANKIAKTT